jgi:predicted metal-binding membrane protein
MADHRLTSAFAGHWHMSEAPRSAGAARSADALPSAGLPRGSMAAAAAAVTLTLGLSAASWAVAVWQMSGMDMGSTTKLGPFPYFIGLWVAMMAAMMLPGATAAVARSANASGRVGPVPLFVGSYLAVWTLVGFAVYAAYRPHGPVATAVLVILAGVYELSPVKRRFRCRCQERVTSGVWFGLCCVASSLGLMLIPLAVGVMSVTWMSLVTVVVLGQKLLPAKSAQDVALAVVIVAFGIWMAVAPTSVPGLMPSM